MNIVAYFHAYKFTHFDISEKRKTKASDPMSAGQKLGIMLFGISNPRPQNLKRPEVPYETVKLPSNKLLEGWFIATEAPKGTVILFHGYSGEKSSMLDKAAVFRSLGYNTLLVDFMGSGGSEGNQTTIGFKEAQQVKTSIDFISQRGETNIILFGTSLGATAVMKAFNDFELPVESVILECPFSTMLKTVENRFAAMGIPTFPMANLLVFWGGVQNGFNAFRHNPVEYARSINRPTLLLYGEKDQRVTPEEIQSIYKELPGPKTLVTFPLAGHENYLTRYKEEWTEAIASFLE